MGAKKKVCQEHLPISEIEQASVMKLLQEVEYGKERIFKVAITGFVGKDKVLTPEMGELPESELKDNTFEQLVDNRSIIEIT